MKTMKTLTKSKFILAANATRPIEITLRGQATLEAAAADGKGPRRFTMLAYDGKPMQPSVTPPMPHPVVVDLSALDITKQKYPVLKDHDPKMLVGHTEQVTADTQLRADGVISGAGLAAKEIVASADNGFSWGISMGAVFREMKLIPRGQSILVNGQMHAGPVFIARNGRLRELSFLTLAADDDTAVSIAAEAAELGEAMSFADWLKANGFQPETKLTAGQKTLLRAQFKACKGIVLEAAAKASVQTLLEASDPDPEPEPEPEPEPKPDTGTAEVKAQLAAIRREQQVYRLCGEAHEAIAERAIKAGWGDDVIKTAIEAAELRAQLPRGIQIRTGKPSDAPANGTVLEAAACMAGGLPDVEKIYDAKAVDEAGSRFRHGIGLQELLLEAAWANGYTGRSFRQDQRGVLEAAFHVRAAGFSTNDISGILSNVANKFLLQGFMAVESSWRDIAAIKSVNDFKTVTSYRLNGDLEYEEVGPGGEIKHGKLTDDSYTNQAKTYAKMLGITRQDQINDDMGALTSAPSRLGRGAGLKFNKVFWTAFLNNSSFFLAGNSNYQDGAATALSIASLTAAELLFLNQTDPDGAPLGVAAEILLVPNALSTLATQLTRDLEVRDTTASTKYTTSNPHAGKFRPVRSSYLSNSTITGYSAAAWYLLSNPAVVAVIEACFLNGRQEPTVETADADFNTLGIQMRGYHDFGVALQEYRGGVKSKGTA